MLSKILTLPKSTSDKFASFFSTEDATIFLLCQTMKDEMWDELLSHFSHMTPINS